MLRSSAETWSCDAGIPTLVVFDTNGEVITCEGRQLVSADPDGAHFPWKPQARHPLGKRRF